MLKKLAAHHSATSFLNSFLLEWEQVFIHQKSVRIPLKDEELIVPLKQYSRVGRHLYEGNFFLKSVSEDLKEISFEEVVLKISELVGCKLGREKTALEPFVLRVSNSLENMEAILQARISELESLTPGQLSFATSEQLLFAGHTCHPTPKAKSEFAPEESERYSPEFKAAFPLEWLLLDTSIYSEKRSEAFSESSWLTSLFQQETGKDIPAGFTPLPMHPFQKKILFAHQDIKDYLKEGKIQQAGVSRLKWLPTSSLRTLYRQDSPFMLKFSLSVKLTNSLRNLLAHELDRGLFLHQLFETAKGKEFLTHNPQFSLVHEPVFAGICDKSGSFIQESLVLGRYNAFREEQEVLPVATLCMNDVNFGKNLIQKYIDAYAAHAGLNPKTAALEWFSSFLKVAIAPLIRAASDYGILLGSHQQNMLIRIKNHLPEASYFRDCNGTGLTHEGARLFSGRGIIVDHTAAAYLFGYYVFINTTFNVLASIAYGEKASEEELLQLLRALLLSLKKEVKDTYLLDYLLDSENLMHKGNFLCSLGNINENTQSNPLAIYTSIQNPLRNVL